MEEKEVKEIQKKVTRKRRLKMALLTAAVILVLVILIGIIGYLFYYFQIKPAQERVDKANQVTEFLDFYDFEISKTHLSSVQEIMKEDDRLFSVLKEGDFQGDEEYHKIVQERIVVYNNAILELQAAHDKISGYDKSEESAEIKRLLQESISERMKGYKLFVGGFETILAGGTGDDEFDRGRKALEDAIDLEEKANVQFEEDMKRIFGEKQYQKMVEQGEIKEGVN